MKVLVTCIPQAGHLNPMAPLIAAFARSGDDVVVATGAAVREQVEATGARFEPAGRGLDAWFGRLAARTRGAPGDGLPPERIAHYFVPRLFAEIAAADMVDEVLAAGERLRPDLVVFDAEAFAGPLVARLLGARSANHLFGPLPPGEVTQLAADAVSPLWRSFGLDAPPHAGTYDGDTIAVCPPAIDRETPPSGRRLLLRPVRAPAAGTSAAGGAGSSPLVYFSLGTMWSNADVVATVLQGLSRVPVRVVATLGSLDPAELPVPPPNVELHRYLPQDEVLPAASLVVHHAGAGTMFGAFAHGLPQVALPQAADNFVNAERLTASGAGIALLPSAATADALAAAVSQVLAEPSYATAARRVAAEIAAMPTADEVVQALRTTGHSTTAPSPGQPSPGSHAP